MAQKPFHTMKTADESYLLSAMDIGELVRLADGTLGIVTEFDPSPGIPIKHIVGFPDKARGLNEHHVATSGDTDYFHALSMGKGIDIIFSPCGNGTLLTDETTSIVQGTLSLTAGVF